MSIIKKINRKKAVIIAIVIVFSLLCACVLGLLFSIRFKVGYLFFPDLENSDYTDFKRDKAGLEEIINELDAVIKSEDNFLEKYGTRCDVTKDGFVFFDKEKDKTIFPVTSDNWQNAYLYINKFPVPGGIPGIEIYEDFPDYVVFTHYPKTPRIFVYTRGEYPKKLIDSLWEEYEFVEVHRLARGWYDIRPHG